MQEILKQQSRKYLSRYPRIFFCHVPKCAGVSLSKAIYASVYPSVLKATKFTAHIDLKSSRSNAELLGIDMMTARECQLVSHLETPGMLYTNGHCIARPDVVSKYSPHWHFLTILRDPVDRFISEFVYNRYKESEWLKHNDDIDSYIDSPKGISAGVTYARYFSGITDSDAILADPETAVEAAVANLRRFAVAGTLDDMPGWIAQFNQRFKTKINIDSKNKSPNQHAFSDITNDAAIMTKIRQRCETDSQIYQQLKASNAAA